MKYAISLIIALIVIAPAVAEEEQLIFWHTQTQVNQKLLTEIVDAYNATNPPMKVVLQFAGNYTDMYRKLKLSIGTKDVPDMIVAYESMIAEYAAADAVVPLDEYINDEKIGLSKESLADFFPSILESNRYPQLGNKYYTFPFTKSVLMMYYNADMLKKAGIEKAPETWDEFAAACKAVKAKLKKEGYAISTDASTLSAFIFSFGGKVISDDGKKTLYDSPEGVAAFSLIYDLCKAGGAYQVDRESYGDSRDFSVERCAFFIRSSTNRPYVENDVKDKFNWDMAMIPRGKDAKPATVLFGANIAIMKKTQERQRAAWAFIKYFSSTEVTAKWSTGTGYLPVRKSAAETETVKKFFEQNPRNRRAFDALEFAKTEPGVRGWQAVRTQAELAVSKAIGGRTKPDAIAKDLADKANKLLEKQ